MTENDSPEEWPDATTRVGRFLRNFRRCSHALGYEIHDTRDRWVTVFFDERGYNFTNLREEKGWEFNVEDIYVELSSGEPRIRATIHIAPDEESHP